jgi:ABC-type lipoprotein release transport system permease subunit
MKGIRGNSLAVMAWRNLWRNRRRTLLTLSSIVFGVFLAVLFTAMQDQNWADTIDLAARLGGGHVTLEHPEYLDSPKLTLTVRDTDRLAEIAAGTTHVSRVAERISGQTMLSTAGDSFGAGFIAIDPAQEDEYTLSVLEGLVEGEMFETSRDRGIILGARLAENLSVDLGKRVVYTMTDVNGDIVAGLGRVSGIIRTGSPSVDGGLCLLPIDSVRDLLGYAPDEAVQVAIFIDDQRRSDVVAASLQEQLDAEVGSQLVAELGGDAATEAAAAAEPDLDSGPTVIALPWHRTQPELAAFISMKVGSTRFMEVFIAILVAAGIFNTLFVSVMERLREFGIMNAIGFSPRRIFSLVMLESFWLAVVGLVASLVVTAGPYLYLSTTGIDFSAVVGDQVNMELAGVAMSTTLRVGIFPESAAIIALFAVAAIMLSGLYPAWKAGRVEPIETIRLV